MPHAPTGPDGRRTSYAQNGEDIVFLRAFADQEDGRWIDVGANHPVNDSVTKNFYDTGWRGINIEPVESFYRLLVEQRPHDVNIRAAVSEEAGGMVFHRNDSNLDLSTFDEELVRFYRERGDRITDVEVPVLRLDEICSEHLDAPLIDILKIDTEGHELSVVLSHDFERYPVRAMCAEATWARLDPLVDALRERGMVHVNFDGLNAWFVRDEESSTLGRLLSTPASPVLDWYHPAIYQRMMQDRDDHITALSAEVKSLEQRLSEVAGQRTLRERMTAVFHRPPSTGPRT